MMHVARFLTSILLALLSTPGWAASPTFDTKVDVDVSAPGDPQTINITVGSGQSNYAVLCGLWSFDNVDIVGMTIGGSAATKLIDATVGGQNHELWGRLGVSSGSNTVSVDWASAPPNDVRGQCVSYYNVNAFQNANSNSDFPGAGGTVSLTLTTANGDTTVTFIESNGNAAGELTTNKTIRSNAIQTAATDSNASTGSSTTHTWTITVSAWTSVLGVNLQQTGGVVPKGLLLGVYP
jgi:hypothetical protein